MPDEHRRTDSQGIRLHGAVVVGVLLWREILRFKRQPARIVAAIGTPLLLWLMLASGFAESFRGDVEGGDEYGRFLLPGMMTLVAVFTAIFSTISIIDDRNEGWLQSVLVSPAPSWSIALGKIAGGTLVAFFQSAVLIAFVPLIGIEVGFTSVAISLVAIFFTAMAMTGMGSMFAWRCETTQAFHAVMNLLFMPMWLLSGAFFPIDGAARWLRILMQLNPLTWCTEAVRDGLDGQVNTMALLVAIAFAVFMTLGTTLIVSRPVKHS